MPSLPTLTTHRPELQAGVRLQRVRFEQREGYAESRILVVSDTMLSPLTAPITSIGSEHGKAIPHWGECTVSIPDNHQLGQLEGPWHPWLADPRKHVLLLRPKNLGEEEWLRTLKDQIEASPRKKALLLFHGHWVSTQDACRRAAQIAGDLNYDGPVILFAWTVGSGAEYGKSREGIGWSAPYAAAALETLCNVLGKNNLDVLPHSLGVDLFASAQERAKIGECFNHVILAAPDIHRYRFVRDQMPLLISRSRSLLMFYSSNDRALNAAEAHTGYLRLGAGWPIPKFPPMITIDATRAATEIFGFGHSYSASHREILSIIYDLMVHERPFNQIRFLRPIDTPEGRHYEIRP